MNYKVSIIIPVYNAGNTVRKCVESIVYGEEKSIEVILVDDASKDNSWAECEALQTEFEQVKCFKNEANRGVSYTRNQGLDLAQGEYILFVDSDDWVSGKYVKRMLEEVELNPNSFVLCGYVFWDQISECRKPYIYSLNSTGSTLVSKEHFFQLCEKVHLQQLWNKIFCKNVIKEKKIYFDETQNMGEDFQFVLDYIEAARCESCIVLNEALYYYIRANRNSLMSNFGLINNGNEYKRYEKLRNICGRDCATVDEAYIRAINNIKQNYIYQVMHDHSRNKNEKITFIESIMQDGKAIHYYNQHKWSIMKENIVQLYSVCEQYPMRIKDRLRREKNKILLRKVSSKLKVDNFSIISQNCIGGVFYHDMGKMFATPTINLFFKSEDFVRFVLNLKYYLSLELKIAWNEEYPIGVLDDVTIYFMHYQTCTDAKEMWDKRKARMNYDKIVVFCTDMEEFSDEVYNQWQTIEYPKVLFTASERFAKETGSVYYSKYKKLGKVPDLIPRREFYKDNYIVNLLNELK